MATVVHEFHLDASPDEVWDAVRDVGALHTRLVPDFVIDTVVEGDARRVTFASGLVARERIVDIDDARRRIAWSVVGADRLEHHNASLQLFAAAAGTRAVWIADVLPHAAAPAIEAMVRQAAAAMQRHFAAAARDKRR
ncbi:MAG: SRPBCC family protein [Dokdonella sp.]|uniref:SRPBCC family protein n=1 Tax=Dokdonella sp. TaxID=2291710 RepID=UPI003F7FAEB6